jgi:hypothetical protein
MLDIHQESVDELLSRVLTACRDTERVAVQLAQSAGRESLRLLLQDRAASYRGIARELQRSGGELGIVEAYPPDVPGEPLHQHADIDSIWEAVECSTLICFRDALDAELPPDVDAIVRRGISDGVSALERLRSLPREE